MPVPEPDAILARRKRTDEKFRLAYDFSRGDLEANDTLAPASNVKAFRHSDGVETTDTMLAEPTMTENVLAVVIQGGAPHEEYDIQFEAQTVNGDVFTRYVRVSIGPSWP